MRRVTSMPIVDLPVVDRGEITFKEKRMKLQLNRLSMALVNATLVTLAGCGGGGGGGTGTGSGGDATGEAPVAPGYTRVTTAVLDGAIQNALVCFDKNVNGTCDADEAPKRTNAEGKVSIDIPDVDVGKFPLLAMVGTDAVDADNGAVLAPYQLSAPVSHTAVVTPLTTLVQHLVSSLGITAEEAEKSVQASMGVTATLFEDPRTTVVPEGSINPALVARTLVLMAQAQGKALSATVGTPAADGNPITQANLTDAIWQSLLNNLSAIAAAPTDASVLTAVTPATKENAIMALLSNKHLTAAGLSILAAHVHLATAGASATPAAPGATFSLNRLSFTDVKNYFVRVLTKTLAQSTPDGSGNTRYVERRYRKSNDNLAQWNTSSDPSRQANLHWNGTAWASCAVNFESVDGPGDVNSVSTYNYCDNFETGKGQDTAIDISGKPMTEVFAQISAAGDSRLVVTDPAVLGPATFPTGSKLNYSRWTPLMTAIGYYPGSGIAVGQSDVVNQYSLAVSAGGLATAQGAGVGCNSPEFQNTNGSNSTSLEGMMSAKTGTPCDFGPGGSFVYNGVRYTNPDPSNEAWGNSTVGIGTVGNAPVGSGPAPGFFTTNVRLRVAFKGPGANPVTYYACKERFNNGSSRNCKPIGTGSYSIASLGDARVLTLNQLPAQASALNYTTVWVERGGLVYSGFQSKLIASSGAGLNKVAATALFAQLGIGPVDPEVPLTLTAGSYQGGWDMRSTLTSTGGKVVYFNGDGSASCQDLATGTFFDCTMTITNPATGAFALSQIPSGFVAQGTANFMTGAITGTFTDPTAAPTSGSITGQRR